MKALLAKSWHEGPRLQLLGVSRIHRSHQLRILRHLLIDGREGGSRFPGTKGRKQDEAKRKNKKDKRRESHILDWPCEF